MGALLTIAHLTKSFPGQVALDDVDVTIQAGSTHALVGQNGSGKSTLIKILAGYHQPTGEYEARFGDPPRPLALGDGRGAHAAGIRFVHQDLGVVDGLSAVENVALGNGYETAFGGRINWRAQTALARDDLAQLGFTDFDVADAVFHLIIDP